MDNILEKINKSTLSILGSQSLQEVCKIIVEEGKGLTNAEHGIIYLLKQNKLEVIYSTLPEMAEVKPKKRGFLRKAWTKGEIVALHTKELAKIDSFFSRMNIHSLIILPLLYHDQPIGVLVLHSPREEFFTEKEIELLRLFRSVASIALEKTQLYAQTQNALEIRDRFISLASHELRTPLTSINGYIQLLYGKLAKSESPEARWVKELYTESTRLTHLVKELLDINRIKQGQLQFQLSEVNLKDIVQTAIERFRFINPDKEVILHNGKPNQKFNIIGDSEKLLQMSSALLSNSAKFSRPKSPIKVSLASNNKIISLEITDEGKGIPKSDLEKVFEGFYKSKNAEHQEGMGVGLLFVKHIVEIHKGKLTIDSEEDKGTTIEVKLPCAKL
jgi:K+-sensing histidine kinase KdpD